MKLLTKLSIENLLHPFQTFILGQKNLAPKMAAKFGIPLIFYGESEAEYGNPIADPEAHLPENRFNDSCTDRDGRFWLGSMDMGQPQRAQASFYRVDPDLSVNPMFDGMYPPHGRAFPPDGTTLYQTGFDPSYGRYSAGRTLNAALIKHAAERGARFFDFGYGDEDYKNAICDNSVELTFSVLPLTPRGALAALPLRAALAARRIVKRNDRLRRAALFLNRLF